MSDDDWDDGYTSDDVEDDDDPYEDDDGGDQEEEDVEEEDEDDEEVNQTGYVEEIDDDNDFDAEREDEDQERGTGGSMSNYEYAKPWGGNGGFMDSYGIERTAEGYQEANELVDTMREAAEREGDGGRWK